MDPKRIMRSKRRRQQENLKFHNICNIENCFGIQENQKIQDYQGIHKFQEDYKMQEYLKIQNYHKWLDNYAIQDCDEIQEYQKWQDNHEIQEKQDVRVIQKIHNVQNLDGRNSNIECFWQTLFEDDFNSCEFIENIDEIEKFFDDIAQEFMRT